MIIKNEITSVSKLELMDGIENVLNEESVIKYVGLYNDKDKEMVLDMIDDHMKQSDDIGIVLFYDKNRV